MSLTNKLDNLAVFLRLSFLHLWFQTVEQFPRKQTARRRKNTGAHQQVDRGWRAPLGRLTIHFDVHTVVLSHPYWCEVTGAATIYYNRPLENANSFNILLLYRESACKIWKLHIRVYKSLGNTQKSLLSKAQAYSRIQLPSGGFKDSYTRRDNRAWGITQTEVLYPVSAFLFLLDPVIENCCN